VILKKEPVSNVITLNIEGAERFNFFRQPDFVHNPFLRGSYAVYLKETLIGQGTGKLCHIHRPKIFDALGRSVWGDLNITGGKLSITIPEWWLAHAKYPVVVDPTVGTTTLGSMDRVTSVQNKSPLKSEFILQYNTLLLIRRRRRINKPFCQTSSLKQSL
jgi:hypothetical protein